MYVHFWRINCWWLVFIFVFLYQTCVACNQNNCYSQISVIRTPIIRNYWVIRRRIFSLLSIAIKLPIIRISIIRKIQFSEVIRRSRLKKVLLNYPSRFQVQKSRMVIMISLFGRVRFTHLSELANEVATGNWHRINVHTITWWTVKWVNSVFY